MGKSRFRSYPRGHLPDLTPTTIDCTLKNWLFIGDVGAGDRSAIMFTIIEACRRRSMDPWEYLRDALTGLPTMTIQQISEVTPDAWAKARRTNVHANATKQLAA